MMDYLTVTGGNRLYGTVEISGSKNAALPLIAASILSKNEVSVSNMPDVSDVNAFLQLIEQLGGNFRKPNDCVKIDTSHLYRTTATFNIVKTIRASILVLGPLLSRFGHCKVSFPGGCAIGQRPIDLHIKALKVMGAVIKVNQGFIEATAPNGLQGANITFDKITVGGTQNIIMAATLAHGVTTIINAAQEPEVQQLCEVVRNSGVRIEGIGTSKLIIHGTYGRLIDMKNFRLIPDRIAAGTYMCAAAITNSKLKIEKIIPQHLQAVISKLEEMNVEVIQNETSLVIMATNTIKPVHIFTAEYPGFPTDMQPQFMALATQANGTSTIDERMFENRFLHVHELLKFGAVIQLNGSKATITGTPNQQLNGSKATITGEPNHLKGSSVFASDIRAASSLILAALAAPQITSIYRIHHLDRGYEKLDEKLRKIGAKLVRIKE